MVRDCESLSVIFRAEVATMQIKRIEPNNRLVIVFCCDDMFISFAGGDFYVPVGRKPILKLYVRNILVTTCLFCGTKIDYDKLEDDKVTP